MTAVRDEVGEDTAGKVSDDQILRFLNIAQRRICAEGSILLTCATASTVASQEQYSIPSDYLKIEAVFIHNTTSGHKVKLKPMLVTQRDPAKNTGNPTHYYIWGLNVSGVNSYYVGLNPIPSSSGTSDLEIYYRQQPQTMVSGGTAPEILTPWQDGLISFACWKIYRRRGKEWLQAALEAKAEWQDWVEKAKSYINPLQLDWPTEVTDTGGYLYSYGY